MQTSAKPKHPNSYVHLPTHKKSAGCRGRNTFRRWHLLKLAFILKELKCWRWKNTREWFVIHRHFFPAEIIPGMPAFTQFHMSCAGKTVSVQNACCNNGWMNEWAGGMVVCASKYAWWFFLFACLPASLGKLYNLGSGVGDHPLVPHSDNVSPAARTGPGMLCTCKQWLSKWMVGTSKSQKKHEYSWIQSSHQETDAVPTGEGNGDLPHRVHTMHWAVHFHTDTSSRKPHNYIKQMSIQD